MGEVKRASGNALGDLFFLAAIVLCVASLALATGLFLYVQYLQSASTSKVDQLQRAKAAFEPSLIQELTRLDDRMRAAGDVLGAHLAPSAFFRMLEGTTITTVAFQSLDFQAQDSQHMTVKMDGLADSVNSIALQADLFSKGGMLTSPIFSNINREQDGVHFSLSGIVNPVSINYVQEMAASAAGSQPAAVQGAVNPIFNQPAQGATPPAPRQAQPAPAQQSAQPAQTDPNADASQQ